MDLQVNGGGGVLLNATPTAEAMWAIAKAHRQFGTTALLPTVITDHPDILGKAAQAALTAFGKNGVCGLHIEGPHISQRRRGTHNADHIRPFDDMVALALRARPKPNLTFLVSDAMPTIGGPPQFDLYGDNIKLDQGRLSNAEGSLAGAHTTLAAGIRRLVSNLNIPVQTALELAISVPCAVMGLDLDRLQGQRSDALLHLNAQGGYAGPVSQISPPEKPR